MRRAEVLRRGIWRPMPFEKIRRKDKVRLFEEDGTRVVDSRGEKVFHATGRAYIGETGQWVFAYQSRIPLLSEEEEY